MGGRDVLVSGKTPFRIEVPYTLIESGQKGEKPMIVYLHGFGQNVRIFRRKVDALLNLRAYHLFIQGPYPIYDESRKRKVRDWGRSWYLYDGEQQQFVRSLELTSEFIQEVIDKLIRLVDVNRLALVGYSMGGYQAGYFALSRWKHVNDLAVVGGRIKTEVFRERSGSYGHLNVLALHGSADVSVEAGPQRESAAELEEWGAKVDFRELDRGHELDDAYVEELRGWLRDSGYVDEGYVED
ncbi:MAG: hypothetical protein U5K31_13310 [Balneolaceae bacterium]|nr:hypothetical protein [Balneolaceae bacterium]